MAVTVAPLEATASFEIDDAVIARSERALVLREAGYPERIYFPIEDVDAARLRDSGRTTVCPRKGWARYYHVVIEGRELRDSAWYYPEPLEQVAEIAGHIAFYADRGTLLVTDGPPR